MASPVGDVSDTWVQVGQQDKETGHFVPAYTYVECQVTQAPAEYQFRWFMGAQWYPFPELVATTTGNETVKILIPLQTPLPRHTQVGVTAYGFQTNDVLDGGQKVQTQVGTGWIPVADLAQSLSRAHSPNPLVLTIPILNEAMHTECILRLSAVHSPHPWDSGAAAAVSVVLSDSEVELRPEIPPREVYPAFYKLDDLQAYRRVFVGSILPDDPAKPDSPSRFRVPVWMYLLSPGETRTPEAFYLQALDHALTVCGLTRAEFLAKPDLEVLVQVLGYFAWSCPYQIDREAVGGALYDQCGCIREIPNAALRAGDCEDLAREMFLAYWWFREKTDIQDELLSQLQHWVHEYAFVFVDIQAENGVLHMAARLVPYALDHHAVDLPSNAGSDLPILYLEPTERVWGTRTTPSVLELTETTSSSTRTLHPFAKVDSWYIQDLAYYCDEWTEVRAPVRTGLHPREFKGRYALQPWYEIPESYKKQAEWYWNHLPPVPWLTPADADATGGTTACEPPPRGAHQCIYLQTTPGSTLSEDLDRHAEEVFRDTVLNAKLYHPRTRQFTTGPLDHVRSLVHAYPLTIVPGHRLFCVYAQLS